MANDKENGPLTERLEQALRDLASEKAARSAFEQQMAAQAAKMEELTNQLQALSQPDRRRILDSVGLKNVSAVPRPIEPIRALAPVETETNVGAHGPRWAAWKALPKLELWQCVALSLNLEPTEKIKSAMQSGRQQGYRFAGMGAPAEFFDRLAFCKQAISTSGPITPQGPLYVGILKDSKCPVLLRDVATFLHVAQFGIPEQLAEMTLSKPPDVDAVGVRSDVETDQNQKKWNAERLLELSNYRRAHGTKRAAEKFAISESRVRQLLPSEDPQPTGYSVFNTRTGKP
jgi:hypothetical protein